MGFAERTRLPMGKAIVGFGVGVALWLGLHLQTTIGLPALVCTEPAVALAQGPAVKPRWAEMGKALIFLPLVWGFRLLRQPESAR